MLHFIYTLRLTDAELAQDLSKMTAEQHALVGEHFAYLQTLCSQKIMIMAGRTDDVVEGFGICLFKADNETAARHIMQNDPAVAKGLMQAKLYPFRLALFQTTT